MVGLARGSALARPGARLNAAGLAVAVAGAGGFLGTLPTVAGWAGMLRTASEGSGSALSVIGAVLMARRLWTEYVGRPARGGR
jgi:hypothetical protein